MASAAVNSAAHQAPPMSMAIPPMPRIRPPRMLKGAPHPNNSPPPPAPHPENAIWVQGKWRSKRSNAAKDKRATQDIQATKAVRHDTHGLDIYAYRHIRTNQVVYSFTRTLQDTKVLKQLVFHGKKTVPASIRRDHWTPYFSIHFPPTPSGALEGLFAFQKLRELSLQRQLSPPDSLIRVTQEDIDVVKSKLGTPVTLQEMAITEPEKLAAKVPKLNEILPKKLQAKKLMDQKATSVADAAFVLEWIASGPSPLEKLTTVEINRLARRKEMTRRARKRIDQIREGEKAKDEEIRRRAAIALKEIDSEHRLRLPLTPRALQQLSMEQHGVVKDGRILRSGRAKEMAEASRLWPEYIEQAIHEEEIDVEKAKDRHLAAKKAEREAMKQWFATHDAPTEEKDSVWLHVAEERAAALRAFDEAFEAREGETQDSEGGTEMTEETRRKKQEEMVLEHAEKAARKRYEEASTTEGTLPRDSLEVQIEKSKQRVLKRLERDRRALAESKTMTKEERQQKLNGEDAIVGKKAEEETRTRHVESSNTGERTRPGGSLEEQIEKSKEEALGRLETDRKTSAEAQISRKNERLKMDTREIKMFWADINDGLFAPRWPSSVVHGSLAPFGTAKKWMSRHWKAPLGTGFGRDEEAWDAGQRKPRVVSKTVHVMGSALDDGWMPARLAAGNIQPAKLREKTIEKEAAPKAAMEQDQEMTTDAPGPTDVNIMFEEKPKGVWGRVKGWFGR